MLTESFITFFKHFKINSVIRLLIFSDFLIWSANQFFVPIFAVFVVEQIPGASIETVGISSAIYFIVRSIFEIPVGLLIDRTRAEKDDLYFAFGGTLMSAFIFFSYSFITEIWQLYFVQVLLGIGYAVAFPGWWSMFTRHIDKKKEALEWSLYDVTLALGMAGASALGGVLAFRYGFHLVFFLAGLTTFIGAFFLLSLRKKICRHEREC